jgi:catechol 2,3-dioxygenase-like lactoylglutathione lyase family enzyme
MSSRLLPGAALLAVLACLTGTGQAEEKKAEEKKAADAFARPVIDLGVVVSDIQKSAKFYTEALGFTEVEGFSVGGEFCKDAGLTDGRPLTIRVFVLAKGEQVTHIKLMQVVGPAPKKAETENVLSQYGFRYLTIFITDTDAALARLQKAGVKPLAKSPVPLPRGMPEGFFLTCVKDPDGNFIELVGPKAKRP